MIEELCTFVPTLYILAHQTELKEVSDRPLDYKSLYNSWSPAIKREFIIYEDT